MCKEDADQVTEIDREAFPNQWPPPNYKHEVRNRLSHYIVICDEEKTVNVPEANSPRERGSTRKVRRLRRLFSRRFFGRRLPPTSAQSVVGFVGLWVVADEAHITSIAVREAYRLRGLGELLLISAIDLAKELKAGMVTLEVRVSNTDAQNLYKKYKFNEVGMRKGYYIDRGYQVNNREDALLMSTRDIHSDIFQSQLRYLKEALTRKLDPSSIQIIR